MFPLCCCQFLVVFFIALCGDDTDMPWAIKLIPILFWWALIPWFIDWLSHILSASHGYKFKNFSDGESEAFYLSWIRWCYYFWCRSISWCYSRAIIHVGYWCIDNAGSHELTWFVAVGQWSGGMVVLRGHVTLELPFWCVFTLGVELKVRIVPSLPWRFNRAALDLLIKALRAKNRTCLRWLKDEDVVHLLISKDHLKHRVLRVSLGEVFFTSYNIISY